MEGVLVKEAGSAPPTTRPQTALQVEGLSVRYGATTGVVDVDLTIARGETVALLQQLRAALPDVAMLYVTHDQTEALALADRVGVMRDARAAIKRECLMVVEEGVAAPEDVDRMCRLFTASGLAPFQLMDRVGLDVVLDIEEHYAAVRPGLLAGPRRLLRRYVERGWLGVKTGRGFYETG